MGLRERRTTELVRDVADDIATLVRKEVELARVEVVDSVVPKVKGAGLLVGALVLCLPGLFFLVVALALALPMSPALGFAAVGGTMLVLALLAVLIGWRLMKRKSKREALETMKEDVQWARDRL